MVVPAAAAATAAANAAKAAGSVGATALGITLGKSELDLSRDIFQQQMRQTKRLWTANWAESSTRRTFRYCTTGSYLYSAFSSFVIAYNTNYLSTLLSTTLLDIITDGETITQAAEQHSEAQALGYAQLYQAEKVAGQHLQVARDQDARMYEMSWRTEVRESLRDDLANQNQRLNSLMLCATVCLGCVFNLLAGQTPPVTTSVWLLQAYVFGLGSSILCFAVSLWCALIVVRRLHDNTAARLERKLFAQSTELQTTWQQQLQAGDPSTTTTTIDNDDESTSERGGASSFSSSSSSHNIRPTGPQDLLLIQQSYEQWVAEYIDPVGKLSVDMLSLGIVTMFVTAGVLIHTVYHLHFDVLYRAVPIFWSLVAITCTILLAMNYREDRNAKTKRGVYDVSWQDIPQRVGPFAKISHLAHALFQTQVLDWGSITRCQEYATKQAGVEREGCTAPSVLHARTRALQEEATSRTRIRQELIQLVTTATEELEALPEELTTRTNKLVHLIDESDTRTSSYLVDNTDPSFDTSTTTTTTSSTTTQEETNNNHSTGTMYEQQKYQYNTHRRRELSRHRSRHRQRNGNTIHQCKNNDSNNNTTAIVPPMMTMPFDAQRIPVSLNHLRMKLGDIPITTLLRLRNCSNEPIRLKSGVHQIKEGRYVTALHVVNPQTGNDQVTMFYPGSEVPPRSEVLVVARSNGSDWFATSGIRGTLVYTNRDESWTFIIRFRNNQIGNVRRCRVEALRTNKNDEQDEHNDDMDAGNDECWQITKDEYDSKANNEVVVCFELLHGTDASKACTQRRQSNVVIKTGCLFKKLRRIGLGLGLQWQQRRFVLTPNDLIYSSLSSLDVLLLRRDTTENTNRTQTNNNANNTNQVRIRLKDITQVVADTNTVVKKNVFQIHTTANNGNNKNENPILYLSANTPEERDDWITTILERIDQLSSSLLVNERNSSIVTHSKKTLSASCPAVKLTSSNANTGGGDQEVNLTSAATTLTDSSVSTNTDDKLLVDSGGEGYSIECVHRSDNKIDVLPI